MDDVDRVTQREAARGIRHADPLRGVDVGAEYRKIKSGTSGLCERIQGLVVARWEDGR